MRLQFIACIGLAAMCAFETACGSDPKINTFNVSPLAYCASTQTIHVDWSTSNGTATLQVDPLDASPQAVAPSGSKGLPPRDMKISLVVTKGAKHTAHPPQIVHAADRHALNGLVGAQPCTDGWVKTDPASFGGGSNAFDPNAHPTVISNKCRVGAGAHATCKRNINVVHGANTWKIAPDSALDVSGFNAPLSGDWSLQGELLKDESCGNAPDAVELDLNIEFGCKESAQ